MKKILAALLVLGLLLSGCDLFKKDPVKAVNEGIAKFSQVKKMSSSLDLSGTVQSGTAEKPANLKFSLKATGKTDSSDEKDPKADSAMKVEISIDDQKGAVDVALKIVGKKIFAKFENLALPGADPKEVGEQFASILSAWWSMPITEESSVGKFTKEQQDLQELFNTMNFFVSAVEDGEELIQGVETVRYRVEVSKEAVTKFLVDAGRITGNEIKPEEELALGSSLKDMEFSGAVWVGDDDYIHRIRGTLALQPKDGPSSSFDFDFSGWDYDEDVEIVAPEGAKEFNPLMLLPFMSAFGPAQTPAPAAPAAGAVK